jgi:hypothetical protein
MGRNLNGIGTVYGAPTFLGPVPQKFGDGATSPCPRGNANETVDWRSMNPPNCGVAAPRAFITNRAISNGIHSDEQWAFEPVPQLIHRLLILRGDHGL